MKSIIFNQHQVNHALKNEEGMFRTICKFRPINPNFTPEMLDLWEIGGKTFSRPQFKVGETIFVKESFIQDVPLNEFGFLDLFNKKTWFRATDKKPEHLDNDWVSPVHMKQEHSRLTLRIKSVKVERLQDISEEDCLQEGVNGNCFCLPFCSRIKKHDSAFNQLYKCDCKKSRFISHWNSTHKKPEEKWEANPFVFCFSYEVVR